MENSIDIRRLLFLNKLKKQENPLSFIDFKSTETLIYYDMTLLFIAEYERKAYLVLFLDIDCGESRTDDRWLIIPINAQEIQSYKENKTSLRELILGQSSFYIIDTSYANHDTSYEGNDAKLIPEEYLPSTDSYFDWDK